jgi:hypothetical protein
LAAKPISRLCTALSFSLAHPCDQLFHSKQAIVAIKRQLERLTAKLCVVRVQEGDRSSPREELIACCAKNFCLSSALLG